ncbi:MAG: hypothetical protein JST30_07420 [Armatimonadetes bacterium]|nr:hypothetical protein [Armatimonadota bacterium]
MADPTSKYITEIVADAEFNLAMINFGAVCSSNAAALGLTPANLLEISAAQTSYTTNLTSWVAARSAANLALENKDIQKKATKVIVSKWAKTFRANPAVSDALLDQLMLPPHKTPGTKTPPTVPMDPVANGNGQGLVKLTWKRNGNIDGTTFVVETRSGADQPWTFLDSTTKARIVHQAEVGAYIGFRISAKRNGLTSPWSVPVVLWEDGVAEPQLSVAA